VLFFFFFFLPVSSAQNKNQFAEDACRDSMCLAVALIRAAFAALFLVDVMLTCSLTRFFPFFLVCCKVCARVVRRGFCGRGRD
jgi:hypothetical protein